VTTGNNARTGDGRVPVIGPGVRHPVPIQLNAAAWAGGQVYGTDGRMYYSNGSQWLSFAEQSEIVVSTGTPSLVTVGAGGDYPHLWQALQYLTRFSPQLQDYSFPDPGLRTEVRILSGTVMTEPVLISRAKLGWVKITSEDVDVNVTEAACPRLAFEVQDGLQHGFIQGYESDVPVINTHFVFDYTGWPTGSSIAGPANQRFNGMFLFACNASMPPDPSPPRRGFSGWSVGIYCTASDFLAYSWYARDCRIANILGSRASIYLRTPDTRNAIGRTAFSSRGTVLVLEGGDFRRVAGVSDSGATTSDIEVRGAGTVQVGGADGGVLAGYNVPVNQWTPSGFVSTANTLVVDAAASTGIIKPTSYTVATVPSASAFPAHLIHVSDGDSGAPCLAVSDGTDWLRIALGAAVST
jgi:hypothetical protein